MAAAVATRAAHAIAAIACSRRIALSIALKERMRVCVCVCVERARDDCGVEERGGNYLWDAMEGALAAFSRAAADAGYMTTEVRAYVFCVCVCVYMCVCVCIYIYMYITICI